jgi:hypothetical protein
MRTAAFGMARGIEALKSMGQIIEPGSQQKQVADESAA